MTAKVLVVDDDEINRIVLGSILEEEKYTVFYAENGAEGVAVFDRERPDIVLMDVLMPQMDGREAAVKIKELAGDDLVPLIFLTAISDEQELAECVAVGGDDFLRKPFSRTILLAKIKAFLRTRTLYGQLQAHHEEMVREYLVVEKIFARLNSRGALRNYPLNYISTPQSMFNGDMLLAAERSDGGVNIFVGDATGHGLPAAVSVLPVSDIFYDMTERGCKTEDIILAINDQIKAYLPTELFLCAFFLEMDASFLSARVWNGGLPDGIVYNTRSGAIRDRITSSKLPLGVMGSESLDAQLTHYDFREGDSLYLFSDGVTELQDETGAMLGMDGLERCIIKSRQQPQPFQYLQKVLTQYRGQRDQSDDLTMIEITPEAIRHQRCA